LNQTAAIAALLASCILFILIQVQYYNSQLCKAASKTKTSYIANLTCWHNNIFGYKLRTD